mmetsp:Transcript_57208/g.152845  ORF Transcript_57208/g.152845 Transcript_57208/m.152845 type:complete len:218 (+) Transcript_57208:1022-1675(+)
MQLLRGLLAQHQLIDHRAHDGMSQHAAKVQVTNEAHVGQEPLLLPAHLLVETLLIALELLLLLLSRDNRLRQRLVFLLGGVEHQTNQGLWPAALRLRGELGVLLLQDHNHVRVGLTIMRLIQRLAEHQLDHLAQFGCAGQVDLSHALGDRVQVFGSDLVQQRQHLSLQLLLLGLRLRRLPSVRGHLRPGGRLPTRWSLPLLAPGGLLPSGSHVRAKH